MKKWLVTTGFLLGMIVGNGQAFAADDDTGTPDAEELSYKEKKDLLTETALEYDIPPEILKAIAYEEAQMRQFTEDGEPVMNENEDGGIGIMQVTLNEDDFENREVDRERLKNDTAYNIQIGAELLNEKWEWTENLIPQVNNGDRHILENWYFAVLAYNGLDRRNDPNVSDDTYQEDLYGTMTSRNLLPSVDLPEFDAEYREGENRMRFSEDDLHVTTETKTPSTQMFETGTKVYSYAEEPGSTINFRLEPSLSSRQVGDVPLYMPLTVEGELEHDNSRDNHFGFYPFHYADIHGYMASSYVREGEVTPFYDVRKQEVTEAVGFLEVRGIISGYPDGTFRPYEPILRRHAAAMLADALQLSTPDEYTMKATDMESDDLGYNSMKAMEYHGLMTGSNGNIRPNEYMTRAQMASVLTAAFEETLPAPSGNHNFDDVPADFWNYDAINQIYQSGLSNQDPFRPGEDVTRSQFALFLKRAMTLE
ncbi:S-layer homology domain-containing protein [Alteribacillus iranensis]|uniref:S-layer homology domain-containing protein n=1 Tax=Alteribacillus iranensis TaxID=930128 RepID=A0A1I2BUC6_9BACI|nr:S-layer homology domain-containing protein [Alteribacillus iranensis]SFE59709.1 S-layer homology domain-containing protein [Alteribacillus iranensis]